MFCLFAGTPRLCAEHFLLKCILLFYSCIYVILFVTTVCEARKYCHGEVSIVKDSNDTVLWVDYNGYGSPIVFSNPSCLDERGNTIKRICHNGSWIPEESPICDHVSSNEFCPDHFYEYRGFCIIKQDEHMPKNSIFEQNLLNPQNTKNISCDGTRSVESHGGVITEKHCNNSNYVVLPSDHRFHICPENCVPSEFGTEKCFCKVGEDTNQTVATVENALQKKILSRLSGTDICKIGTKSPSKICDCYKVITHNFYGFSTNITNCSIIETYVIRNNNIDAPSMVLIFDDHKRNLTLLVKNPKAISPSKYYAPECFTNAGTDVLRTVRTRTIRSQDKKSSRDITLYELQLEKYIGEYWCEAFSLNLTKIQSNTILAYREDSGPEYSLRISIRNVASHFDSSHNEIRVNSLQNKLSSDIRKLVRVEVRFMKYLQLNLEKADLIIHLSTDRRSDIVAGYESIKEKLQRLPDYLEILHLRAAAYCLPDTTVVSTVGKLHWELTRIWERRISKELCFQDNGVPLMRMCQGDFITGASWSDVSGSCWQNIEVPAVTKYLHESLYSNISMELIDNITSITSLNDSISYLDIYFYSELIRRINVEEDNNLGTVRNVFRIINNISKMNRTELSSSQILFNATDTLLLLLDNESSSKYLAANESYIFSDENILIQSVNPFATNISGLYLLGKADIPLNEMKIVFLYTNETIGDIDENDSDILNLAVNVPQEVLKSIESDSEDPFGVQIIFTIFYRDSLFANSKRKTASKVISVTIPGYGTYLEEPIPIIMRSSIETDGQCGYWDLGQKLQRQSGKWSSFGGQYSGNFLESPDLHICHFSHLTHFALLIVSEPVKVEEGSQQITAFDKDEITLTNFYLTVITIIGGVMSIIGIFGIYVTAVVFPQWREKDGTKILLNLSTAIFLEIIFLQFSGVHELISDSKCKFIGCLLHYTLLSKSCWMLIYASLQYRRFVKVFGAAPKNLILKSMFFGWGLALLPVILTLLISPESYSKTNICYIYGFAFHLAVVLPVGIVILLNLIVFIIVMYNVSTKQVESSVDTKFSVLQLYLAILLFSVLGLPWLFALLAEFVTTSLLRIILLYLFCITGTLQGFVLFVFYVLINEETRQRWRKYLSKSYN